MRVILAATGEQLGIMRTQDAIKKAQEYGLDLVEVAPNANPPVCRIVDFGKYRYEIAKQEKERRHATTKLKEIKFRVNIDNHDYLTKIRHGEEFLVKGNKVRIQLQFKGRENVHKEFGEELMARIKEDLSGVGQMEMEAKHVGRNMIMIIAPLPASKRKRKYAPPTEPPLEEEHEEAGEQKKGASARSHKDDLSKAGEIVEQ